MDIKTIQKNSKTTYTVSHVQLNDKLTLYKITAETERFGKVQPTKASYGICKNCYVEKLEASPDTFCEDLNAYNLIYKKEVKDLIRKDYGHFAENWKKYSLSPEELFCLLPELSNFEDLVFLRFSPSDGMVYPFEEALPLPRSIFFPHKLMTSKIHDLNKCLDILKARDDVIIYKDNKGNELQTEINGNTKFIEFKWMPKDEDWKSLHSINPAFRIKDLGSYDYLTSFSYSLTKRCIFDFPFLPEENI